MLCSNASLSTRNQLLPNTITSASMRVEDNGGLCKIRLVSVCLNDFEPNERCFCVITYSHLHHPTDLIVAYGLL